MFNLLRRRDREAEATQDARHPTIRARPVTVPPVYITARHDPVHPRDADPQTSQRVHVSEPVVTAPPPVPYTLFWNVGRDIEHAWPRQWLYQFASPRDWLSVMQWPFTTVGHTQAGSMVYMPPGRFIPQLGRSNIDSPAQTSLGAMAAVQPVILADPNHAKILF